MKGADFFWSDRPPERDYDPLDEADPQEVSDLALHVRQCARRYASLRDEQFELRADLYALRVFVARWFAFLMLIFVLGKAVDLRDLAERVL